MEEEYRRNIRLIFILSGIVVLAIVLGLVRMLFFNGEARSSEETADETEVAESAPDTDEDGEEVYVSGYAPYASQQAVTLLDSMTLTEQIYQMFIVSPEQITGVSTATVARDTTREALEKYPVGGLVYSSGNIVSPEQCTEMIANSQSFSKIPLFIAVDEEGGEYSPVADNSSMGTESVISMQGVGDTGDTYEAYSAGYTIGSGIGEFGFNVDLAPVADIYPGSGTDGAGQSRYFGSDADLVADMVSAAVTGFGDSGVLCALKYFPGYADAGEDDDEEVLLIEKSYDELWDADLKPFKSGIEAGADIVIVGHVRVPEVTGSDVPASMSDVMISILKEDLGFTGLVVTDSMQKSAVTGRYTSGTAAAEAVKAGADMILLPDDLDEAVSGILKAVESGEITEERISDSVLKILDMKIACGLI